MGRLCGPKPVDAALHAPAAIAAQHAVHANGQVPDTPVRPRSGLDVAIAGLGFHLPQACVTNADLAATIDTTDTWIRQRTGIHARRRAEPDECTSDLACRAAVAALRSAGLEPSDIDLLIVATVTPDTLTPSTACWLQKKLEARHAAAMDLSAACCGFLYAVHVAVGMVRSGMHRRALVVGAETLSRFVDPLDRQTCVLFGDGAGAAVIGREGLLQLLHSTITCDGRDADLISIAAGGSREPASARSVAERRHFVALRGQEVFRQAVRGMADLARESLDAAGLRASDIDWLVPHQANARIVAGVAEALGVEPCRVALELADTGNTSAASIPIALSRLAARGDLRPGQHVLTVAFGAGVTGACQIMRVADDSPVPARTLEEA